MKTLTQWCINFERASERWKFRPPNLCNRCNSGSVWICSFSQHAELWIMKFYLAGDILFWGFFIEWNATEKNGPLCECCLSQFHALWWLCASSFVRFLKMNDLLDAPLANGQHDDSFCTGFWLIFLQTKVNTQNYVKTRLKRTNTRLCMARS